MGGRKHRVETHPQKAEIIKALIKGVTNRQISKTYHLSEHALGRYLRDKLVKKVTRAKDVQDRVDGEMVLSEIEHIMGRMKMLYDACHEYLLDPDNDKRYELGPRAWEIMVSYLQGDSKIVQKDNLQVLLDRAEGAGEDRRLWLESKYRHADPRKLIIETAGALTKQLELLARICGELKDSPAVLNQILVYLPVLQTERAWQKQKQE